MIGRAKSFTVLGHRVYPIDVEADILQGEPRLQIVGLGDSAIKESRERLRSAINASGFFFPPKSIVVNLLPADLPKEGALLELAMAVAILKASGQLPESAFSKVAFLGCLSLDGSVLAGQGILAAAIEACQHEEIETIAAPSAIREELGKIPGLKVYPITQLKDLYGILSNAIPCYEGKHQSAHNPEVIIDMAEIEGHNSFKMALACAIAGGHHCLLIGPPGSGKTLLARAVEGILPPLDLEEALEVTQLYSAAGMVKNGLIEKRPFRSPHHTTSDVALVGGGSFPSPGEITLSHRGVLFLDELLEFKPAVLQALREPLEEGKITISRARGALSLPADFTLIAATNPCRCGYLFGGGRKCRCSPAHAWQKLEKILGPFEDRLSFELEILPQVFGEENKYERKNSQYYKEKIQKAWQRMKERNQGVKNGRLSQNFLSNHFDAHIPSWRKLVKELAQKAHLSYRSSLNTLRSALTFADMEDRAVKEEDIFNAFCYRMLATRLEALKAA